ncbi:MAG TPA: multicopper oxidase domain-containing protein [Candidatus Thermoplasmatota archaeon]|nr:multicopper oxidase domain-containing protein [Candidatus Thermoplasmatota archaeon]
MSVRPVLAAALLLAAVFAGCVSVPGAPDPHPLKEYHIEATQIEQELYPGKTVTMWAFNGEVPGPTIKVREGDLVRIHFTNKHTLPHTLHFHGDHPFSMDGDDFQAVAPGDTFTYEFIAGPAGAYVYHCHVDTYVHVSRGMYGQYIVEPKRGFPGDKPDKEVGVIFGSWDPNHNHSAETYLLNGKAFPSTTPIQVEKGERVRFFMSSVSDYPVSAHLHGGLPRQVWPVDQDIDVVPLFNGETRVVDFVAKEPGAWMFHDHFERHLTNQHAYPGGALTTLEVGKEYWGKTAETMGHHGGSGHDGGSKPPATHAPSKEDVAKGTEVAMKNFQYAAPDLKVKAGTTVVWKNYDAAPHTVTSNDKDGPLDSGNIAKDGVYAYTFTKPGTYSYRCVPHSAAGDDGSYQGMVGKVIVT